MITQWVCSQLGAREKYAIPRAIRRNGNLADFYTDIWMKPGSWAAILNKRLNGRYHPDLGDVRVKHFTRQIIAEKFREKLTGSVVATDIFYDKLLQHELLRRKSSGQITFFCYSYSSRLSMKAARSLGYVTILGQINPGPAEAAIVTQAFRQYRNGIHKATVPDETYWERWREEVGYADKLIVNSSWSLQLLTKAGVPPEKCVVIPLAYESPAPTPTPVRNRKGFDYNTPLRLLYLGGIGIRKGFHILVEAMRLLVKHPVHLDVVGMLKGPRELIQELPPNVTLHGSVPGDEVGKYYQSADIFIFPTLSDGFGLTQLEAQSHRLPLIVSAFCAEIVTDGINGLILEQVDAQSITEAVLKVVDQPELLERFSANAVSMNDYSLERLSQNLATLE